MACALAAAIAARAAGRQGSDKYFAMHDVLFENQTSFSGKGNLWTTGSIDCTVEPPAAQVPLQLGGCSGAGYGIAWIGTEAPPASAFNCGFDFD